MNTVHTSDRRLNLTQWLLALCCLAGCSNGSGGAVSGDPRLASLTLSAGTLVPAFDPDTITYTVNTGFLVASTTVTATAVDAGATVKANSRPLAVAVSLSLTGPTDGPIRLAEGANPLTVLVTTLGTATKTYTIMVTRDTAASFAQQAYLKASNPGVLDLFGGSVALAGDTLAVGAPFESSSAPGVNGDEADNSAVDAGAVYVFVRSGTTWTQQAYLKASNPGGNDRFGESVALAGDTLAVGALYESSSAPGVNGDEADNSVNDAGAVYVFVRSGSTWTQQAYVKASNPGVFDLFGASVALAGDTLAVGALGEASAASGINGDQADNSASATGAVYVFVRSGTTWTQQAYLKASNPGASDFFGASVALDGDTLAVGAPDEDSAASGVNGDQADNSIGNAGAVYVFR